MNPRIVSDELRHRGRVLELHTLRLAMPSGAVVERDLVHYNGAVVVLPVQADGSIVMIRNYRFAVSENLLELPAGMLEKGEDPALAAARELTEETGYTAGRVERLGMFYTGPGSTDERMYAYLAEDLQAGPQDLEEYEQITVETFSDAEVRQMVADERLHDGKSIAALALYWLRKGRVR